MKKHICSFIIISVVSWLPFLLNAQTQPPRLTGHHLESGANTLEDVFREAELRVKMKADGLSEAVIDKLIQERKRLEAGGRTVNWISHKGSNPKPLAACSGMGVESGWGAWQGATGSNSGGNPGTIGTPTVPVAPQFNLTSGNGVDPCTPGAAPGSPAIPVVAPGFGNTSIQLGQPQMTGCQVEQLTYSLNVTPADSNFVFSYAFVMYDPTSGHAPQDSPFIEFIILDANGDTVPCSFQKFVMASFMPGVYQANNSCLGGTSTYYKPWTTWGLNLVNYIGQTLTVKITNADCIYCGHFAHSYWDFECANNLVDFCSAKPVTICSPADTSISNSYQWSSNGNPVTGAVSSCYTVTPNHGDVISVWTYNSVSKCGFHSSYTMNDTCATGVNEQAEGLYGWSVFPSPASTQISIDLYEFSGSYAEISLLNLLGETLLISRAENRGIHSLDVSRFSEGIYFVKLRCEAGTATRKIIVTR